MSNVSGAGIRHVTEYIDRLQCPTCRENELSSPASGAILCAGCGTQYPLIDDIPLLFAADQLEAFVERDKQLRRSEMTEAGSAYHWREYDIPAFLPEPANGREILLLGCGDGGERTFLHQLGFQTLAFDITRSTGTDFLADAHILPLQDGTIDTVLTMQVFEHLHSPWIAASEIARILRPGGWVIGSVAFLKPYHRSYFHMSYKGVESLFAGNNLVIDKVAGAQSLTYSMYGSQVPLLNRPVSRQIYSMFDRLLRKSRAWVWSRKTGVHPDEPTDRFDREYRLSFNAYEKIRFAPSVVFRAQKRMQL